MVDPGGFFALGFARQQEALQSLAIQEGQLAIQNRELEMKEAEQQQKKIDALRKRAEQDADKIVQAGLKMAGLGLLTPDITANLKSSLQSIDDALAQSGQRPIGLASRFDQLTQLTPTAQQLSGIETDAQIANRRALIDAGVEAPVDTRTAEEKLADERDAARLQADLQLENTRAAQRPQTDIGKLIADQQDVIAKFGEDSPQAQAFEDAIRAEEVGEPPSASDVRGMRQDFVKLSQNFIEVRAKFETIQDNVANPDTSLDELGRPIGDVALVFAYMKLLDPASTVREGEQAQARNAAGVPEQLRNLWNNLFTGNTLSDAQRASILNRAGDEFNIRLNFQREIEGEFTRLANLAGFDPQQVVMDFVGPSQPAQRTVVAPAIVNGKPVEQMTLEEIDQMPIDDFKKLPLETQRAILARQSQLSP